MPGLRELQLGFAAAVLRRQDAETAVPELGPADERLARRLAVYRVNARENFAAALEAAYPVLRRQLDAEEFRSLAWSYQQRHPSPSGNLHEVGRRLPAFLGSVLPGTEDEYLRDLARLEWAAQESMGAADGDARFDPRALAAIPASRHDALRFELHPSVRILKVGFPVFALWREFQAAAGREQPPAPAPKAGVERILVRRSGSGIELYLLEAVEHCCLECLLRGESLGDMADAALGIAADPDIAAVLARWAARGVITQLHAMPEERP